MSARNAWHYLTASDHTLRERFGLSACEVLDNVLVLLLRANDQLGRVAATFREWVLHLDERDDESRYEPGLNDWFPGDPLVPAPHGEDGEPPDALLDLPTYDNDQRGGS